MCSTCGCKGAESFEADAIVIPDADSVPYHIINRLNREGIKWKVIEGNFDAESFEAENKKVVGYIVLSDDRYANYTYVSTNAEKLKQSCKDSFMESRYDFEREELEKMWDNFSLKEAVEATGMYLKEVDLNKAILIYDGDANALNAESFEVESFDAPKSPALKNLSTIAVLALAIFAGKKLKE